MVWNQPGEDKDKKDVNKSDANQPDSKKEDKKDPWKNVRQEPGPPDLDAALRSLRKKLGGIFGGGGGGSSGGGSSKAPKMPTNILPFVSIILFVIIGIWVISGIFIVNPAEKAVVLRFGKYNNTIGPGPHWIPQFIDTYDKVNVGEIKTISYSGEMLTRDTNIVEVEITVNYQITNPKDFLFNMSDPKNSVAEATASAVRQVIGQTDMDQVLSTGRSEVRDNVQKTLVETIAQNNCGIEITGVNFEPAKTPKEVSEAFDDAIKAHEDEKRYISEAQAYANNITPIAKGQAMRIDEIAKAYSGQVVLNAQGDIASFLALLPQYKKLPTVTRERLYLDAISTVLSNSRKILVDTKGDNLLYLPIDKLLQQSQNSTSSNGNTKLNGQSSDQASLVSSDITTDASNSSSSSSTNASVRQNDRENR